MALTPDGKKLYVACGRSGSVSVIDTERKGHDRRHRGRQAALGRGDPLIGRFRMQARCLVTRPHARCRPGASPTELRCGARALGDLPRREPGRGARTAAGPHRRHDAAAGLGHRAAQPAGERADLHQPRPAPPGRGERHRSSIRTPVASASIRRRATRTSRTSTCAASAPRRCSARRRASRSSSTACASTSRSATASTGT